MDTSVINWACLTASSANGYRFAPKASHILRILLFALSPEKKTKKTFFSTYNKRSELSTIIAWKKILTEYHKIEK